MYIKVYRAVIGHVSINTLNLYLQFVGAFAEFERSLIRERQREGIKAAKDAGKHIGVKAKLAKSEVNEIKKKSRKVKR